MSTPFLATSPEPSDDRAELVFFQALARPIEGRDAFLDESCGPDSSLRAEVEGLLRDYEKAGSFLHVDAPISPELEAEFVRLKPEEAGERIGPYKLLEQIGEGGFGRVWVAEQEKPIRRRVALKIIKLGMDTKDVVARFEQERQALAMMDHPNIAKVLEAGATPLGRPFFVMELVRGVKITDYCDQAKLPTEERLRLFIAVCQAVQHAHQKGIIHRDLKPSNILVTLHDGVPIPKVIDFGVAKATQQQRLTDLTVYTQYAQMIGTPLYMSPEQAEMSGLDVDTRSDIYSLGVLLYELLIGKTPFDPERLMKASYDEMRRVIREEEPQKPSTLLSTMAAEVRTDVARHRDSEAAKLISRIKGDLDWIVMKALEKDRNRRYETASGLARDIERHLASEPVLARPPSNLYRFRRFAKRNKIAFAAIAAVLAALVVGLGVSTWMFFQELKARERAVTAEQQQFRLRQLAETQERNAKTEASKSKQVAQFLKDMLKGVGPSVSLGSDTRLLREILDRTAERVGSDLKDQPEVEADLRNLIGNLYLDLGEVAKAETMIAESLALRRKLFGDEHPAVADALHSMANVLGNRGDSQGAERLHREALAMRKKLLGDEHPIVASSMNSLAFTLRSLRRLAEAEAMARDALVMTRKLLGNDHPDVADALLALGQAVGWNGRQAESEALHREGLDILRKAYGNEHPQIAAPLLNLSQCLHAQGRLRESEEVGREVLAMDRKFLGNDHLGIWFSLRHLSKVLADQGKLAEAETLEREALELCRKSAGNESRGALLGLSSLRSILSKQRKFAEAEAMCREALAIERKLRGNEHSIVARAMNELANVLMAAGKLSEAEATQRESLEMQRKLLGEEHADVATSLNTLGWVYHKQSKLTAAESAHRESLAIWRKLTGQESRNVARSLHNLARVLMDQGKLDEAEAIHREALAMRRKLFGSEHADIATSLSNLAELLGKQNKLVEAEAMNREAVAMRNKLFGGENPDVATSPQQSGPRTP